MMRLATGIGIIPMLSPNAAMATKNTKKATTMPTRVARAHMRKNPQPTVLRFAFMLAPVGWSGRKLMIGGLTVGFSRAERASKPCAFQQLVLRARARQRRVVAARSASAASPGWVAPQAKPHVTEALDTRSVGWCNYHGHSGLGFWKNASAAFSVQSYAMVNHLPVWRKYDRSKGLWCMNR